MRQNTPWGLSKRSYRFSEKTTENSKRLGRQARPGIEPGTYRLPVLIPLIQIRITKYFLKSFYFSFEYKYRLQNMRL